MINKISTISKIYNLQLQVAIKQQTVMSSCCTRVHARGEDADSRYQSNRLSIIEERINDKREIKRTIFIFIHIYITYMSILYVLIYIFKFIKFERKFLTLYLLIEKVVFFNNLLIFII